MNKRLPGGCHLTRWIPDSIEQARFATEQLGIYSLEGDPKPFGSTFEGRASQDPSARRELDPGGMTGSGMPCPRAPGLPR